MLDMLISLLHTAANASALAGSAPPRIMFVKLFAFAQTRQKGKHAILLTDNAYLMGGKYALANVDGTPAAGGVLMPYASPGTVVTVK
jgi:hypothetical protein